MSIVRSCLRVAAVAALKTRAWKGVTVFDSDNRPLEEAVKETEQPYFVVYTDDDDNEQIDGRDVGGAARTLSVIVEFGIAAPVKADTTTEPNAPKVAIPATDGAYELTLDILDRQVMFALFLDPRSTWGEHFRKLTMRIPQVSGKRGGVAERGVRWAARQRIIQVDPVADPQPGMIIPDTHPVKLFLDAALAAPPELDIAPAARFLSQALVSANDWTWRQAQAALGLTDEGIQGIKLPPPIIGDEEAPELEDIEFSRDADG